jgi:hypothetical protein
VPKHSKRSFRKTVTEKIDSRFFPRF